MAQNEQRRSQPEAIFSDATGPLSSRTRGIRGPQACPGTVTSWAAAWRWTGVMGSSVRRSDGVCEGIVCPETMSPRRSARSG